jgi:hypothetical protein
MQRRIGLLILCCGLSAAPIKHSNAGEAYNTLSRLPEAEVARAFAGIVRSAGEQCTGVGRFVYIGDYKDAAYYTVQCTGGSDFAVQVQNGGNMSTRVTSCAAFRLFKMECWKPFQ